MSDPTTKAINEPAGANGSSPNWISVSRASAGFLGCFALLNLLGEGLRDALAASTGARGSAVDPDVADRVMGHPATGDAEAILAALEAVEAARDAAFANGNPQAIASVLLARMAVAFAPQPVT